MTENLEAVRDLYAALIGAWNDRDAEDMARQFAEKGGQVGFDGSAINGREEIEAHLAPIFKDHPTPPFVTIVREVREIAPGAAILRAVAGMCPPGQDAINPDLNAIQTLVAARDGDDAWKIEMFQNTPAAFHGREEERDKLTRELQQQADRSE